MKVLKSLSFALATCLIFSAAAFGEAAAVQNPPVKSTTTASVSKKAVKKQQVKKKINKQETAKTEKAAAPAWGNAPDFTAKTLDGTDFTLSSLRGKVILLNFWATWCPHCRYEIPDLIQLSEKYKKAGLEIVGVAVEDNASGVKDFAQEKEIKYTVVMYGQGVEAQYRDITGIPTTFVIDKTGNIVDKYIGAVKSEVIDSQIKKLLK